MSQLLQLPVEIILLIAESPRLTVKDLYSLLRTHTCLFNILLPRFNHLAITRNPMDVIYWASAVGNEPMMRLLEQKGVVFIRGQVQGPEQCEMVLKQMRKQRANLRLEVESKKSTGSDLEFVLMTRSCNLMGVRCKKPEGSALEHALMARSHHLARLLLDEGAAVIGVYSAGKSLLHIAILYGAEDITIERMITRGADVNAKDNFGNTPLHCSPSSTYYYPLDHKIMEILLKHGADTAIENIAGHGVIQDRLRRFGWKQLPLREKRGMSPYRIGYREAIRLLLRNGDIRYRDQHGHSGLHMAAASDDVDLAEVLLRRGIDVNYQNWKGRTALHLAAGFGFTRIARMLIEAGADVAPQDSDGITPLHLAARSNRSETVQLLLLKGVDISVSDDYLSTALLSAAKWGDVVALRLLLKVRADIHARDKAGKTPLLLAARYGHIAAVKLLSDNGADILARDNRGRGAAWALARCHDVEAPNVSLVNKLPEEEDGGGWYALCGDFFRGMGDQK